MNKKLFTTLTAGIFAVLSSCSGDVIEAEDPSTNTVQTTAKLTVIVQDAVTGEAIDGVKVTLLSNNDPQVSANGGRVVFENVRVGSHQALVEAQAAGYADMAISGVGISAEGSMTNGLYIARDGTGYIRLYPLTSTLEGYLFYNDKDGVQQPAAGVDVRLQFNDEYANFVKRIFTATVGPDGKYSIDSLPAPMERYAYSLTFLSKKIGDVTYGNLNVTSSSDKPDLIAEATVFATKQTLAINNSQSLFEVTDYNAVIEDADRGDAVVFTFSDDIDATKFTKSMVTVQYVDDYSNAVVDILLDKNTLTIQPVGKWRTSVRVEFSSLKSVNGRTNSTNSPWNIIVRQIDLADKVVELLFVTGKDTIDYNYPNYSNFQVKFERVEGAESYCIYGKIDGYKQDAYTSVGSCINDDPLKDTLTAQITALPYNAFSNYVRNHTVTYLVQAVNVMSKSKFDETKGLVVVDNKKPTSSLSQLSDGVEGKEYIKFDGNAPSYYAGTLYSYLSLTDTVYNVASTSIYFSEDMDTTAALTVGCANNAGGNAIFSRLAFEYKWDPSDPRYLYLTLNIKPSTTVLATTDLDAKCTVVGLKDEAGNPFEFEYTNLPQGNPVAYTLKKKTNSLDFNFITE